MFFWKRVGANFHLPMGGKGRGLGRSRSNGGMEANQDRKWADFISKGGLDQSLRKGGVLNTGKKGKSGILGGKGERTFCGGEKSWTDKERPR